MATDAKWDASLQDGIIRFIDTIMRRRIAEIIESRFLM